MQSRPAAPIEGIWLPLVTPFRDGELDIASLRRLTRRYLSQKVDGLILAATTGEGLTLDADEKARLVDVVTEEVAGRVPVYLGLCGADTRRMQAALAATNAWDVDGYLIASPYYSRPPQEGLYRHFAALAGETARPVLIYNIPYRTGVNMANETMLRLAALPNIAGVKDCCADQAQSFDLIRARPEGFAVMTGEDALFLNALAQGADGGILASAHIEAAGFAHVRGLYLRGDVQSALGAWRMLADLPRLLFAEPSPGPVKHFLWRAGLIDSPEMRLPMTPISDMLARRINIEVERRMCAAA
jgi:4-hydroxy-tetrahydrodipicolinate synthase